MEADTSELDVLITRQHERQHQLSEEITISHQRPRLSWVGGVFLFNESDHQSYWVGQLIPQIETRLDPRVDATSRAAVRTGDRRTDVTGVGDRRRSLHA